jgi:hypothetical protein
MPQTSPKQWMLGLPGHKEVVRLEEVVLLVKGGQLRPTDLVKKLGEPWKAANEIAELSEYFANPGKAVPEAPRIAEAPKGVEPPRPITSKVPRAAATARAGRTEPAPQVSARPGRFTERKPPVEPGAEAEKEEPAPEAATDVRPAVPEAAPEPGPQAPAVPPPPAEKPARTEEPKKERTRALPVPPPRPKPILEPMQGKYYSPVDLLRSASFAFDPKKLLITALVAVPLMLACMLLHHLASSSEGARARGLLVVALVLVVFGIALALTALGFVTRRQLEGKDYRVGEIIGFTSANLRTALIYPVLVLIPSVLALGILWLLGFARNSGPAMASILRFFYILPMAFAFVVVLGAFVYQLASLYVPAAAAIEGTGLTGSVGAAWANVRRQWGRVVLHWLIVTVAFGVILVVGLGLALLAFELPDVVFGPPEGTIAGAWNQFGWVFALYRGLACGLGLTLPLSLLSTLGGLSYMSLRHPATAQLAARMEDTSGIPLSRSGTPVPMEATQPGETRPAPADATRPGPGTTPPPEISDDSDEQPLVKEG